jgi:diguanylate cyclase (GGDEF)-like protein
MFFEEFTAEEYSGTFDGYFGGEEQELLEKALLKKFQVLQLAPAKKTAQRFKLFILAAGRAQHLLAMLAIMPRIREQYLATGNISARERQDRVDALKARIVATLAELGLKMSFGRDGELVEDAADQTPKALAALPNRDQLRSDLGALLPKDGPTAVVFIDLDNFKAVNDKKNHAAGDACLERISILVSQVVVGKGRTYRYGGDEFVVLLKNFTSEEARAVAERIRRAIDEGAPDPDIKITGSIGVAASDGTESSIDALLQAADDAASASKLTGAVKKNKVTVSPLNADVVHELDEERNKAKGR